MNFPAACFIYGWDVIFDMERRVPEFIRGQYWWRSQQEAHVYQSGWGDPDPAEIEERKREEAVNPLLTALPLRRFEAGTLLAVIDGMGGYGVARGISNEQSDEPEQTTAWCFIAVTRRAVEQGAALHDEGDVWPLYNIRIYDKWFRRDAPKAWAAINKSVRAIAEKVRAREKRG